METRLFFDENAQGGAFARGGLRQGFEERRGKGIREKRKAVGVTLGEGVKQEDLVRVNLTRVSKGEAGQEVGVFRFGKILDAGTVTEITRGQPEMVQGGATAHDEFALVRIGHGQGAPEVGHEIDFMALQLEQPGLGIVTGGGQNGEIEEKEELLIRARLGGELIRQNILRHAIGGGFHKAMQVFSSPTIT